MKRKGLLPHLLAKNREALRAGLPHILAALGNRFAAAQQERPGKQEAERVRAAALREAFDWCKEFDAPLPDWVGHALQARFLSAGSLDKVFDQKGKHLDRARRRDAMRWEIWQRVRALRARRQTKDLFNVVGAEFRISASQCKEIFYEARAEVLRHDRALDRLAEKQRIDAGQRFISKPGDLIRLRPGEPFQRVTRSTAFLEKRSTKKARN
jgi:hypothetical protein